MSVLMNPCIVYLLTSPINELMLREFIPFMIFINWNYNKSSQNIIIYSFIFKSMVRPKRLSSGWTQELYIYIFIYLNIVCLCVYVQFIWNWDLKNHTVFFVMWVYITLEEYPLE